ncbi:unnamed protein product, partial [marine sediment metagenome]
MPLKKGQTEGATIEPTSPAPETNTPEPQAERPRAAQPAAEPQPKPEAEKAKGAKEGESPKDKKYVTKTGYLRDPTTGIMYITGQPRPGTDSGWLRCQIAAGVIIEYKPGE